jgi:hypothetical protein
MATVPVPSAAVGGVIAGSVMPAAPALFTLRGTLTRFRAQSMVDKESGAVRWAHNLTLFQAFARRYINCTYWGDHPVDLRPLLNTEVEFFCTSVKVAPNPQYGTQIGAGLPPVNFNGSIDPGLVARYQLIES